MQARAEEELVFGPLALALAVRALPRTGAPDRRANAAATHELSFAFDPEGLAPEHRAALECMESAHFGVRTRAATAEALFSCAPDELQACAESSPAAQVFLAAQSAIEAPILRPQLMGVVNVTPDSFSDGGRFLDPARAIEHAQALVAQGAELLDVGGESTRPGATPISAREELDRILPVIEGLAGSCGATISVDTQKATVAHAALEAGAQIVNDISAGLADPDMLGLVAEHGCGYVAMHMQGRPETMQEAPQYDDPVAEVARFLRERGAACLKAGIAAPKITFDPGIGFGKSLDQNLEILRRLTELRSLGRPLLLGVSRKSFIAHITGEERPADWRERAREGEQGDGHVRRLGGTAAAVTLCVMGGADVLRVHDVAVMSEAVQVASALRDGMTL